MLSGEEVGSILGGCFTAVIVAVVMALVIAGGAGYVIGTHTDRDPKHSVQSP